MKNLALVSLLLLSFACRNPESEKMVLFNPEIHPVNLVSSFTGDDICLKGDRIRVDFSGKHETSIIAFYPEDRPWDASGYRFVRCEIENPGTSPQVVELGFGDYDLIHGAVIVPPGTTRVLKAVIYRTEHPAYIDSLFPVMHGKPDGTLRGWMATTFDSIEYIRLHFPELKPGTFVGIGKIWLEDPYVLYSAEELKEKFYPFVDRYGQNMHKELSLIHISEPTRPY